ncbi:unnamed protein product [Amoebophrya sp. A25]|nr:unnamed protein product [Amoebophrya sp. A25]|eukprot:GSA25T00021930001.1
MDQLLGNAGQEETDPALLVSENVLFQVTFTRYKLGSPVLYMMKCEVLRRLPPLVGPDGSMHEGKSVPLALWTIKKRYSDMADMSKAIETKYSPHMESVPKFPPKVWSNALFNTEEQVQNRLRLLQTYFDKLLLYPNVRASPELATLLEMDRPGTESLPHFRVCSFGIHQADQVFAVCEIGPPHARQEVKKRETQGRPALFYHVGIRLVRQIGFSSENLAFLREDRLENSGKNMRFNLVLGKPAESYDLTISCSNYQGRTEEDLRIRLLAPSLEDILAEAGNNPDQVDQLLKRICTHCVHDVTKNPESAMESIRSGRGLAGLKQDGGSTSSSSRQPPRLPSDGNSRDDNNSGRPRGSSGSSSRSQIVERERSRNDHETRNGGNGLDQLQQNLLGAFDNASSAPSRASRTHQSRVDVVDDDEDLISNGEGGMNTGKSDRGRLDSYASSSYRGFGNPRLSSNNAGFNSAYSYSDSDG